MSPTSSSSPTVMPPFTVHYYHPTPITDREIFLELISETHNNILACSRILRNYAINTLPDNPTDEAVEARITEIHHYLTQNPLDVYVNSFPDLGWPPDTLDTCPSTTARLDVKAKAYIGRALFNAWIELKNKKVGGTISADQLRRLQLLTFLMKAVLVHEEAKVVNSIFADDPTSKYIKGKSAEVALTGDQGEIWSIFEAGIGCCLNYMHLSHLVLLGQDQSRRYITQDNAMVLADLAAGKWEEFPSLPQTPPAGEFPKRFRVFEDSTAEDSDDDDDEEDAEIGPYVRGIGSGQCVRARVVDYPPWWLNPEIP
ncbi:hypothetical protein BDR04DRAFT_341149 [Suillus decipiens]|nr:hypothetical protein BDR04DRAFT_341149 [Suillus decipiens]